MTDLIDVLLQEHALHRRMLTVLERIAVFVEHGGTFPSDDVARVVRYLRDLDFPLAEIRELLEAEADYDQTGVLPLLER